MNHFFRVFISFSIIILAPFTYAEDSPALKNGYISDNLSIFMHAGPGTNYKIIGSINAGSTISITGNSTDNYAEIIDEKKRTAWVQAKHINNLPGLRFNLEELTNQLSNATDYTQQLDGEVNELKSTIINLEKQNKLLSKDADNLNKALAETSSQLKDQDTNIQKQWFFNGAIVLGLGVILGLILPKFFVRRRGKMDSWQ
jgi:SH3 domain protein